MRKGTILVGGLGLLAATALGFSDVLERYREAQETSETTEVPSLIDILRESRRQAIILERHREMYLRAHPTIWTCDDFLRFAPEDEGNLFAAFFGPSLFCPENYEDPSDIDPSVVSDEELCEVSSSSHYIELDQGTWCHIDVVSPNFELDAADDDDASACVHGFSGTVTVDYIGEIGINTLHGFDDIATEHSTMTRLDDLCRDLVGSAQEMLTYVSPVCQESDNLVEDPPCYFPSFGVCDDSTPDCANENIDDDCEPEVESELPLEYLEEIEDVRERCEDVCFPILENDVCLAICGVGAHTLVECYKSCDDFTETQEETDECEIECETFSIPEEEREFLFE